MGVLPTLRSAPRRCRAAAGGHRRRLRVRAGPLVRWLILGRALVGLGSRWPDGLVSRRSRCGTERASQRQFAASRWHPRRMTVTVPLEMALRAIDWRTSRLFSPWRRSRQRRVFLRRAGAQARHRARFVSPWRWARARADCTRRSAHSGDGQRQPVRGHVPRHALDRTWLRDVAGYDPVQVDGPAGGERHSQSPATSPSSPAELRARRGPRYCR